MRPLSSHTLTSIRACIASAMRIVFTMRISSVISQADVAYNGLFIGLWTEAEVTLGFMVACSLCFPKLIQVKGKQLRASLTWGPRELSPSSTNMYEITSWGETKNVLQPDSNESQQQRSEVKLHVRRHQPDFYILSSTTNNSEYSQSVYSQTNAAQCTDKDHSSTEFAHRKITRSISVRTQEVPVRLDSSSMSLEQLDEETGVFQESYFDNVEITIENRRRRETV